MWIARLIARLAAAAVGSYALVWLGCGVPAMFQVYFVECGHNAYLWFVPAFVIVFGACSLVPQLRIVSASTRAKRGAHES